jgi:hypothetical protein
MFALVAGNRFGYLLCRKPTVVFEMKYVTG